MKKFLSGVLAVMFVFGGMTNINALTPDHIEPRASIFEETKSVNIPVKNSSGSIIGYITTKCTAKIKEINGTFSVETYSLSAPSKWIGSTKVTATVTNKLTNGLKLTVTWNARAEFSTIPPKIVNTYSKVVYNFN